MFQSMLSNTNLHVKYLVRRSLRNVTGNMGNNVVRGKMKYGVRHVFEDFLTNGCVVFDGDKEQVDKIIELLIICVNTIHGI